MRASSRFKRIPSSSANVLVHVPYNPFSWASVIACSFFAKRFLLLNRFWQNKLRFDYSQLDVNKIFLFAETNDLLEFRNGCLGVWWILYCNFSFRFKCLRWSSYLQSNTVFSLPHCFWELLNKIQSIFRLSLFDSFFWTMNRIRNTKILMLNEFPTSIK